MVATSSMKQLSIRLSARCAAGEDEERIESAVSAPSLKPLVLPAKVLTTQALAGEVAGSTGELTGFGRESNAATIKRMRAPANFFIIASIKYHICQMALPSTQASWYVGYIIHIPNTLSQGQGQVILGDFFGFSQTQAPPLHSPAAMAAALGARDRSFESSSAPNGNEPDAPMAQMDGASAWSFAAPGHLTLPFLKVAARRRLHPG